MNGRLLPESANSYYVSGIVSALVKKKTAAFVMALSKPIKTFLGSTLVSCSVLLSYTSLATEVLPQAAKPQAEILHWWSSAGESAALSVFIDEFIARGGHYYDSTKNDQYASREEAIDRMSKGYPSTLTQWNAGRDITQFYDFGLIDGITEPSLVKKLKKLVPQPVLDAVTHRDEIIAVPINIHSENWMWYSTALIKQSNNVFTKDWKKFLTLGEDLARQDVPLLAVGDQSWQVRILFTSLFLGISRDVYRQFYLTSEESAVESPEFKELLTAFSHLARYSKSFGDGNWNTQVRAVANNKAGATFMGDWAKGEFQILGKTAGKEYGCSLTASNNPGLLLVIDSFILGKVDIPEERQGQALMLDIVSDPEINLLFNSLKGSVSPYITSPTAALDICSAQVYETLSSQEAVVPPYASYGNGDAMHQIDTEIYDLWKKSQQSNDTDALVAASMVNFRKILRARQEAQLATVDE